jgi:prepilin-type N-terminal cleavage/methylation domain-containing protein
MNPSSDSVAKQGFTLIELSIVLVIIGLIIGGVLVGQDLVKSAQLRSTISQVEKYNTEVHTFRTKYNAVPGDITAQAAASYGMTGNLLLTGLQGDGDGNGIIEDGQVGAGGANDNLFAGEISEFWAHMSWANLIDGGFGINLTAGTGAPPAILLTTLNQYVPPTKLGKGFSFIVFSGSGSNFFGMLPIVSIDTGGAYTMNPSGLDPISAYNIDSKVDDGMPQQGTIRAIALAAPITPSTANTLFSPYGMTQPSTAATAASGACVTGAAGGDVTDIYNLDGAHGGNDLTCAMSFRFN